MPVRRKRLLCLPVIALVALALTAGTAAAQNWLDQSFGVGGRVWITGFMHRTPNVPKLYLAEAPDGTLLVGDEYGVFRLQPNGTLDTSFGEGGLVAPSHWSEGLTFWLTGLAVDAQNRPVVFGTTTDFEHGVQVPAYSPTTIYSSSAEVLRYTPTGQLDPSFGDGDGMARTTFGLEPFGAGLPSTAGAGVGALDSQGRPLLIGTDQELAAGCGHSYLTEKKKLIARLTPGGSADGSFGAGTGQVELGTIVPSAEIAVDNDDRPLLLGVEPISCGPRHAVLQRLDTAGNLDPGFGRDGTAKLGEGQPRAVAVDTEGRVLVLEDIHIRPRKGPRIDAARVFRLLPDGSRDRSFGNAGKVTIKTKGRPETEMSSLSVAPNGDIFLSGTLRVPAETDLPPTETDGRAAPRQWITVMQLGPSGKLDRQLGTGGQIRTRFGPETDAVTEDSLVDRLGRLVVLASTGYPVMHEMASIGLARYDFGP